MEILAEYEPDDSPPGQEVVELLAQSWQLLRSLKDKDGPRLARYIRKMTFNGQTETHNNQCEGIDTTSTILLSMFLRMAPNVRSVVLGTDWKTSPTHFEVLGCRQVSLEEFACPHLEASDVYDVVEHLPKLRYLRVDQLGEFDEWDLQAEPALAKLKYLDIRANLYNDVVPFVKVNASTIQELRIGYEGIADIDFSRYPQLRTLHLYDDFKGTRAGARTLEHAREMSLEFWRSIDRIPALDTLSFDGSALVDHFEEAFFGFINRFINKRRHLARTLRTLQFGEGFPLHRFYSLVGWPMSKQLRRIVVPASMKSPEANSGEKEKLRAVVEYSDALGIEVILADSI